MLVVSLVASWCRPAGLLSWSPEIGGGLLISWCSAGGLLPSLLVTRRSLAGLLLVSWLSLNGLWLVSWILVVVVLVAVLFVGGLCFPNQFRPVRR